MALTRVQTGVFGASGSGNSAVQFNSTIIESANTIYSSYTLTTGRNGYSVGPVTILTGKSVTIPTGQKWVVL